MSRYQGYQQDIKDISRISRISAGYQRNGYQEKIDQVSITYLTDFNRI